MKRIAWKFAASSAVLGAATAGFVTSWAGIAPAAAYAPERADAGDLVARAHRAAAENKLAEAVHLLEQAVSASPQDAETRLLLADAYMKSGRFRAAQTTYADVLEIDPSKTRAGLGLALMQVANGLQQQAMSQLERLEGNAAPADLGLAYAIAGAPKRAIELLEPAARSMGATPRVRQKLALAYAFGGDWERARIIAAQDVSPAELAERMGQWAALTSRSGPPQQVAAMLGVQPAADRGQPVQLALRGQAPAVIETPQPIEYAAAEPVVPAENPVVPTAPEPVEAAPMVGPAPAPVRVAFAAAEAAPAVRPQAAPTVAPPVTVTETAPVVQSAPSVPAEAEPSAPPPVAWTEAQPAAEPVAVPAPVIVPAAEAQVAEYAELEAPEWGVDENGKIELPKEEPAAREPVRVQYAAAAETLVRPDPTVMRVARRAVAPVSPVVTKAGRPTLSGARSASGQFVVQIGAFSSAANADRAWQTYGKRYGLRAEQPVTMTIDHRGRLLHRVAISGFVKRGDASQVCRTIQAQGGECFVRNNAGDAAIDWTARYSRRA